MIDPAECTRDDGRHKFTFLASIVSKKDDENWPGDEAVVITAHCYCGHVMGLDELRLRVNATAHLSAEQIQEKMLADPELLDGPARME